MCLIKNRSDQKSTHKKCWEHRFPQYHTNTKASLIDDRLDFEAYKAVIQGRHRLVHPLNSYAKESEEYKNFEEFRIRSYLPMAGDWPANVKIFPRSVIGIELYSLPNSLQEIRSHQKEGGASG